MVSGKSGQKRGHFLATLSSLLQEFIDYKIVYRKIGVLDSSKR
jgi:hypothetical protein